MGNCGEPMDPGREDVEAAQWFARAADQAHAGARNELGCLHWTGGRGVGKSLQKAVAMWEAASAQGHAVARENLRCAQEVDGVGVPKGWPLRLRNWKPPNYDT